MMSEEFSVAGEGGTERGGWSLPTKLVLHSGGGGPAFFPSPQTPLPGDLGSGPRLFGVILGAAPWKPARILALAPMPPVHRGQMLQQGATPASGTSRHITLKGGEVGGDVKCGLESQTNWIPVSPSLLSSGGARSKIFSLSEPESISITGR